MIKNEIVLMMNFAIKKEGIILLFLFLGIRNISDLILDQTLPLEINPTIAKITAITSKMTAKSLDIPATPPKPNRLATSAITAKIIAQRNIIIFSVLFINLD